MAPSWLTPRLSATPADPARGNRLWRPPQRDQVSARRSVSVTETPAEGSAELSAAVVCPGSQNRARVTRHCRYLRAARVAQLVCSRGLLEMGDAGLFPGWLFGGFFWCVKLKELGLWWCQCCCDGAGVI